MARRSSAFAGQARRRSCVPRDHQVEPPWPLTNLPLIRYSPKIRCTVFRLPDASLFDAWCGREVEAGQSDRPAMSPTTLAAVANAERKMLSESHPSEAQGARMRPGSLNGVLRARRFGFAPLALGLRGVGVEFPLGAIGRCIAGESPPFGALAVQARAPPVFDASPYSACVVAPGSLAA